MVSDALIAAAVAVLGVVIAWKVLKGIMKTVVLIGMLVLAGVFVFGGMA